VLGLRGKLTLAAEINKKILKEKIVVEVLSMALKYFNNFKIIVI
jgi:hypothetical protein